MTPQAAQKEREAVSDDQLRDLADDFKSHILHAGVRHDEFDYMGFARAVLSLATKQADKPVGAEAKELQVTACYFPKTGDAELSWERNGKSLSMTVPVTPEQGRALADIVWPCVFWPAVAHPPTPVVARDWTAIEAAIHAYVEDYEMVGEDEEGRDGCYTPTETERDIITDAVMGLLADTDFVAAYDRVAATPAEPVGEPLTDDVWPDYIAGLIETYLKGDPAPDKRKGAIAGIIRRRMYLATPPSPALRDVRCKGDPGECDFNGACMYGCGRVLADQALLEGLSRHIPQVLEELQFERGTNSLAAYNLRLCMIEVKKALEGKRTPANPRAELAVGDVLAERKRQDAK